MSSPVKRMRRTYRTDVPDTSTEVFYYNKSWDNLIPEMAEYLFTFLDNEDRLRMALVCKYWLAIFNDTYSWRYFVYYAEKSTTRKVPYQVLNSLLYVELECSVHRCQLSSQLIMEKTNRLVSFVLALKATGTRRIRKLDILQLHDIGERAKYSGLLRYLRRLLATQEQLARLCFINAELTSEYGLSLLTAAGQKSDNRLKYLNIRNFFRTTSRPREDVTFAQICARFNNITEIRLNIGWMSDILLTHLCGSLKRMTVWASPVDSDFPGVHPKYTDEGWKVLVNKCEDLKAEYHIDLKYRNVSLCWILLPSVPLATFYWCSKSRDPNIIWSCFDEIVETFKDLLKNVHIDVGCPILGEAEVVAVVERCPLLRTFSINGTSVPIRRGPQPENNLV